MIVVCPSCDTHFTLPPSALGPGGRALRCARCGHKWHATQSDVLRADPAAKKNKAPPPPAKPVVQPPVKSSAEPPAAKTVKPVDPAKARAATATVRDDIPLESPPPRTARDDDLDLDDLDLELGGGQPGRAGSAVDFGKIPAESAGTDAQQEKDEGEDPFARISELMMSSPPEPIPDVFASPPPKRATRRKGAAGLWLLLFVLLLSSLGAGAYFLQDRLIDKFPEAAHLYEMAGMRNEVVGAGLAFRNYSSERLVQDNNEVLVVRGVIANTTEQPHEIPLLRLALYNNKILLQEKVISPPQTTLDAHGTVGFRITLDQPDANASRFEVTFTAPKPPEVKEH